VEGVVIGRSAPAALSIRNLNKTFGATRVLTNFSLDIAVGEVHAVLGQNGSGKSTLIKVLSGYHVPDLGGTITVDGNSLTFGSAERSANLGLRFVHQDLALVNSLSVSDNMCLGTGYPHTAGTVRARALKTQTYRDLEYVGLEVSPDAIVGSLTPAQRACVAIARSLKGISDDRIKVLVLDEPTATLAHREVGKLLEIVRDVAKRGVAILYVSHDLAEALSVADAVTVLRDSLKVGTWPTFDLTHDALVNALVGSMPGRSQESRASRVEPIALPSSDVLEVRDLRSGVIDGVSFTVRSGEIVGVAGLTGSGREELLPAIFGANERLSGVVTVEGRALSRSHPKVSVDSGIAYVPDDRKTNALFGKLTARENLTISDVARFWRFPRIRRRKETVEVHEWFEALDIRPKDGHEIASEVFSGGNQQKIILARWLRRDAKVLLLAEPTEGVDVGAQAIIRRQIISSASSGAAVLMSSVSGDELCALCDRVIVLRHGKIAATLKGDALTAAAIVGISSHEAGVVA
jgi:ribose transport system ATP-binding protein